MSEHYLRTSRLGVALVNVRVEVQQTSIHQNLSHTGSDGCAGDMGRRGRGSSSQPQRKTQV